MKDSTTEKKNYKLFQFFLWTRIYTEAGRARDISFSTREKQSDVCTCVCVLLLCWVVCNVGITWDWSHSQKKRYKSCHWHFCNQRLHIGTL